MKCLRSLVLAAVLVVCSGCGQAVTGESLSTTGSTSMEPVMAALMEGFMAENAGVTVTYDPTGSGAGIAAVMAGTADIGLSSRALRDSETGLETTVIALDAIAVVVNSANPVADLTVAQLAGLFSGQITNWAQVGGPDQPVAAIGREAGSGTREGFESVLGIENSIYDQELTSTGAVLAAVAANDYAIGYASLAAVGETVRTVTVDGVVPTEETVLDGTYSIQRPFLLVTREGEKSALVQAFLDYARSDAATAIIAKAGAVQPR